MTTPDDEQRPASGEEPTVSWTPPDDAGSPLPGPAPDAPPTAPDPAPVGAPDEPVAEPPTAPSPLISASPAPTVSWEPPDAAAPVEIAPGLVFASTGSRLVAFIIDTLIVGFVTNIIAGAVGWRTVAPTTLANGDIDYSGMFGTVESTILGVVIGGSYFVLSWSGGRRATIGQRIFSIQVGNAFDGAPLTFEQAIRRWLGLGEILGIFVFAPGLAALASSLQFVWMIALLISTATSPTKQGLHDRFADSALVRPTKAGNGVVLGCLAIFILLVVITVAGALAFLSSDSFQRILSEIGDSI
jgi:uncharacterized RDD family membrane protein YckC